MVLPTLQHVVKPPTTRKHAIVSPLDWHKGKTTTRRLLRAGSSARETSNATREIAREPKTPKKTKHQKNQKTIRNSRHGPSISQESWKIVFIVVFCFLVFFGFFGVFYVYGFRDVFRNVFGRLLWAPARVVQFCNS